MSKAANKRASKEMLSSEEGKQDPTLTEVGFLTNRIFTIAKPIEIAYSTLSSLNLCDVVRTSNGTTSFYTINDEILLETSQKTITVRHSTTHSKSLCDIFGLLATKTINEINPNNKAANTKTRGSTGTSGKKGHQIDDSLSTSDSLSMLYCAATVTTEQFYGHFEKISIDSYDGKNGKIHTNTATVKLDKKITVNFYTRENNFTITGRKELRTLPLASIFCLIGLSNYPTLYKQTKGWLETLFSQWEEINDYIPTVNRQNNQGTHLYSRNGIPQDILLSVVSTMFKGSRENNKFIFPNDISFSLIGKAKNSILTDGSYASDCLAILTLTLALSNTLIQYKQLHSQTKSATLTNDETSEEDDDDDEETEAHATTRAKTAALKVLKTEATEQSESEEDTTNNSDQTYIKYVSPEKLIIRRSPSNHNKQKSENNTKLQELQQEAGVETTYPVPPAPNDTDAVTTGTTSELKIIKTALYTLTRITNPNETNIITKHFIAMLLLLPTTNYKLTWGNYKTQHPELPEQMKKNLCKQLKKINNATKEATGKPLLSNTLLHTLLDTSLKSTGELTEELEDLKTSTTRAMARMTTQMERQFEDIQNTLTGKTAGQKQDKNRTNIGHYVQVSVGSLCPISDQPQQSLGVRTK